MLAKRRLKFQKYALNQQRRFAQNPRHQHEVENLKSTKQTVNSWRGEYSVVHSKTRNPVAEYRNLFGGIHLTLTLLASQHDQRADW
jgi:hypothetical protein